MAVVTTNLGPVTAYGDAVRGGYTGTKEQWEALMADYGTIGTQAQQDAQTASTAAQTATTKASEASASATQAQQAAASVSTPDTTLTQSGKAADAKATGDEIASLKENLTNQYAILNALNGVNGSLTPIKLQGIDATPEGTTYTQNNSYETYYVPVMKGRYYSMIAEKSGGTPYYKLTFSSEIPSAGIEYTYIEKKTSVAVFYYTANSNGYLCVSVYKNQTASIICNEMQYGEIQIIDSNIKTLDSIAYTQIDVGTSARTIEMDTSPIKAKSILSYEGDETPVTWSGGLAIYKNIALIGYNSGYFAMFDLLTGGLVATGRSEDINAHNNNIFFDTSIITNGYPLLYASNCRTNHTECYVYTLSVSNGVLTLTKVQTITYSGASFSTDQTVDWCYDVDKDELIALISKNDAPCSILKFSKPAVFFNPVVLTDSDIITLSTNSDITVRQGATVANGYLFVLNGFGYGDLIVINIDNGETVNTFSLTPMDFHEPEGVAFANGVIYVNFHHGVNRITAYLYKLNF